MAIRSKRIVGVVLPTKKKLDNNALSSSLSMIIAAARGGGDSNVGYRTTPPLSSLLGYSIVPASELYLLNTV